MKRFGWFVLAGFLLIGGLAAAEGTGRAKYVFLMIGDGMGEAPRRLFHDQCGPGALGALPPPAPTGTDNVDGGTTDSAASGTALACGIKTRNGALGVDADGRPVESLAKILQRRGYRIGVVSSVGINDATPGAHYANRASRKEYAGVLSDLFLCRFDFFGVSTVLYPPEYREKDLLAMLPRRGYTVSRDEALFRLDPAKRNLVFGDMDPVWSGERKTPSLADFTREAAKVLKNDRGFFLVVEGGAIDHRAHHNDAAGVVREMIEFDAAVAAAVEFQRQHPAETLIIVTADHDTGGIEFEPGKKSASGFWKSQQIPLQAMQKELNRLKKTQADAAAMIEYCCRIAGLDEPSPAEREALERAAALFLSGGATAKDAMTGYGRYNPLAIETLRRRDARQGFRFTTFGHTNRKVLTNALGVGAERFTAPQENSDIPLRICAAMLGSDAPLRAGAATRPMPPNRFARDYVKLQSAAPDALTVRYGLLKPRELVFTLTGPDGRKFERKSTDGWGRISFEDLTPDTAYRLTVAGAEKEALSFAGRTPPRPKGKLLLRAMLISDLHVSTIPDLYGRLHSRSGAILQNLVAAAAAEKCDLLLLPGDVTDRMKLRELKFAADALAKFKGPVIATPGNHDLQKAPGFVAAWLETFGPKAGIRTEWGVQFVWLDSNDGKLGNPGNREAVEALDPARPAVVITHYQLKRDDYIRDPKAGISDADAPEVAAMLEKLGRCRAVLYVGHKNTATEARLGKVLQINAPQTSQFPNGGLLLDIHEDGILQRYLPSTDIYLEEYARRVGENKAQVNVERDRHGFEVWNRFIPWPE